MSESSAGQGAFSWTQGGEGVPTCARYRGGRRRRGRSCARAPCTAEVAAAGELDLDEEVRRWCDATPDVPVEVYTAATHAPRGSCSRRVTGPQRES